MVYKMPAMVLFAQKRTRVIIARTIAIPIQTAEKIVIPKRKKKSGKKK